MIGLLTTEDMERAYEDGEIEVDCDGDARLVYRGETSCGRMEICFGAKRYEEYDADGRSGPREYFEADEYPCSTRAIPPVFSTETRIDEDSELMEG